MTGHTWISKHCLKPTESVTIFEHNQNSFYKELHDEVPASGHDRKWPFTIIEPAPHNCVTFSSL